MTFTYSGRGGWIQMTCCDWKFGHQISPSPGTAILINNADKFLCSYINLFCLVLWNVGDKDALEFDQQPALSSTLCKVLAIWFLCCKAKQSGWLKILLLRVRMKPLQVCSLECEYKELCTNNRIANKKLLRSNISDILIAVTIKEGWL